VIEPCKTCFILICLFVLFVASVSCFAQQRNTFGLELGETSDKFGTLPFVSGALVGVEGEGILMPGNRKQQSPNIVVGGEIRYPTDAANHASEFAGYGGPIFQFGDHFYAGFHVQIRKFLMPTGQLPNQSFNRYNMLVLELPAVLEYHFWTDNRAFLQAQVQPEFSPHFTRPASSTPFPHPILDHAYTIRASAGYNFGKYYLKGTYETRYFKFSPGVANPNFLANWRTDAFTGGVGFVF
jgi:hypothetical protein